MTQEFTPPQTTKEFVSFINKNYAKNPEYLDFLIENHLQSTIQDGFIARVKRPKLKEIVLEKQFNPTLCLEKIKGLKDIETFLGYKYLDPLLITKKYVMEFLVGEYMDNYNYGTTPCRSMQDGEAISLTWAKYFSDDLHTMFLFLAQNPTVFSNQDLQNFANKYVETLFLRTKSKQQSNHVANTNQKTEVCYYDKMMGMYCYDVIILGSMAIKLLERGLDVSNVKSALEKLPFEEDLGNLDPVYQRRAYLPIRKQRELFDIYKHQGLRYIAQANANNKLLSTQKELHGLLKEKEKKDELQK